MKLTYRERKSVNHAIVWVAGLTFLVPGKITRGNRPVIFKETPEGLLISSCYRRVLLRGSGWSDGGLTDSTSVKLSDLFTNITTISDIIISKDGQLFWDSNGINGTTLAPVQSHKYPMDVPFHITEGQDLTEDDISNILNQLPTKYQDDLDYVTIDLPGNRFITVTIKQAIAIRNMMVNRTSRARTISFCFNSGDRGDYVDLCVSSDLLVQHIRITYIDSNI